MSILTALSSLLAEAQNANREYTLIVSTPSSTYEGDLISVCDGALALSLYGVVDGISQPLGNTLLIREDDILMIEIDWADTYGLVNGEESAVVAHTMHGGNDLVITGENEAAIREHVARGLSKLQADAPGRR